MNIYIAMELTGGKIKDIFIIPQQILKQLKTFHMEKMKLELKLPKEEAFGLHFGHLLEEEYLEVMPQK